ncbi:electrogenic sodium bicarbonate cotransporter [Trichuris trichiura]|uniref:Anion exchange protein n=1 Tax=Trichuris trichiura TaxID=36087 RepID=A0A077Z1R0_TRITR|nr:electrogenic sodium bicarbonate cotransporter [Trichuris trichiura]
MSGFVRKISTNFAVSVPRKDTIMSSDFLVDPFVAGQTIHAGQSGEALAERIRSLIESELIVDEEGAEFHPLFCELLSLTENPELGERYFWAEKSRWIKYEETVEEGERWSKPHISLLTMDNLLLLKSALKNCDSNFDFQVSGYVELIECITESWSKQFDISKTEVKSAKAALLARKQHFKKPKLRMSDMTSPESSANIVEQEEGEGQKNSAKAAAKQAHHTLLRKLPKDTEGAAVLIGYIDGISRPLAHFVRLKSALLIDDLLEVFSKVCYKAKDCKDLTYAADEFISQSIIIPAGKWSPSSRLEPADNAVPVKRTIGRTRRQILAQTPPSKKTFQRTGRIFGGLVDDLKAKAPWYVSDFTDGLRGRLTQTIAAAIFLFFANISKIITFGGVMDHVLKKQIGTIENVLAGGVCGIIYALFAGQPLCVLSATGPCLVFEAMMFSFCENQNWDFLCARFWVGFWTSIVLLIFVAFDASVMVSWITRFTEEAFASLISLIFLVKALEEMFAITETNPVLPKITVSLDDHKFFKANGSQSVRMARSLPSESHNFTISECFELGGRVQDDACIIEPNVYLFSVIMIILTAAIAFALKWFRHSSFFSSRVRNVIADFNVTIAIAVMAVLNACLNIHAPCLSVPDRLVVSCFALARSTFNCIAFVLKPTSGRSWFVNPLSIDPWWLSLVAILPALFFSILILMDQNITSVIVNRPDNKLQKGFGYHLDLTVISVLMIVCSLLGIPFYVAATVISLMHLESLRIMSEIAAPGEKPAFLGIKEQRVTALIAHILIGLAVFLTPVMKLVPVPALLGIFIYMGIVSLIGQQFMERVLIIFMPAKHQPDYPWLRMVPLRKIHIFTAVQILSFVLLAIVEEVKVVSMLFPLMLLVLICIRRFLLPLLFSKKELKVLDDELPSWNEVMKPMRRPRRSKAIALSDTTQKVQLLPNSEV